MHLATGQGSKSARPVGSPIQTSGTEILPADNSVYSAVQHKSQQRLQAFDERTVCVALAALWRRITRMALPSRPDHLTLHKSALETRVESLANVTVRASSDRE